MFNLNRTKNILTKLKLNFYYLFSNFVTCGIILIKNNNTSIYFEMRLVKMTPANTKHLYSICTMLYRRLRRWSYIVQMLYKCFVFAGITFTPPPPTQKK